MSAPPDPQEGVGTVPIGQGARCRAVISGSVWCRVCVAHLNAISPLTARPAPAPPLSTAAPHPGRRAPAGVCPVQLLPGIPSNQRASCRLTTDPWGWERGGWSPSPRSLARDLGPVTASAGPLAPGPREARCHLFPPWPRGCPSSPKGHVPTGTRGARARPVPTPPPSTAAFLRQAREAVTRSLSERASVFRLLGVPPARQPARRRRLTRQGRPQRAAQPEPQAATCEANRRLNTRHVLQTQDTSANNNKTQPLRAGAGPALSL